VWTFAYDQNSTRDRTIVTVPTVPASKYIYTHWGVKSTGNGTIWKIGLLQTKESYTGNTLTQTETYTWDKQTISYEDYSRTSRPNMTKFDSSSYAPILTNQTITRDGSAYSTTYPVANYDTYGNPKRIIESGNDTKQTDLIYYLNTIRNYDYRISFVYPAEWPGRERSH